MTRWRPPLDLAPEIGECGPELVFDSPIPNFAIDLALCHQSANFAKLMLGSGEEDEPMLSPRYPCRFGIGRN